MGSSLRLAIGVFIALAVSAWLAYAFIALKDGRQDARHAAVAVSEQLVPAAKAVDRPPKPSQVIGEAASPHRIEASQLTPTFRSEDVSTNDTPSPNVRPTALITTGAPSSANTGPTLAVTEGSDVLRNGIVERVRSPQTSNTDNFSQEPPFRMPVAVSSQ